MSTKVVAEDVRDILFENADLSDATIDAFISASELTVNDVLSSSGLSSDQLFEIKRWLSAHFAASMQHSLLSRQIGETSEKYAFLVGKGLDGSFYGQQVKILDTSGILTNIGQQPATAKVISY